ncbi:hypothetical protein ACSNN9_00140 [Micromonospora sp. URMC 107]|uniref:hypothetical protein n=1 Tax=Micromonospora sp. URMC 107 TaxID=3423418 RepID=UPI003F1C62A6
MHTAGDVRVEERDDPRIIEPTDAIVRLTATCACGSDLWPYRGVEPADHQVMGPRATPGQPDPELIPSLLAASDVLGTGWFAAVAAVAAGQDRGGRR